MAYLHRFSVEGVGDFAFRDKTYRDGIAIEARISQTLGRNPASCRDDERVILAAATAEAWITILGAEFPAGFNVADLDPTDPDDTAKLLSIWGQLRNELERFRQARSKPSV